MGQETLIALGSNEFSNWGDRKETVITALAELETHLSGPHRCSSFYQTPAFPAGSGPDFINAVVRVETDLPAADVLAILHRIEASANRVRHRRWAPRTLDIDLISQGQQVCPNRDVQTHWRSLPAADQMTLAPDQLILPHPRMQDRAFVLVPLCDVAPDWVHPCLDLTARAMLDRLPAAEREVVVKLP